MAVRVAEYLGKSVAHYPTTIEPATGDEQCPFMNSPCSKLAKGNKPVCSVQKADGENWIVCSHRLCSTLPKVPLTEYQRGVLTEVAQCTFGDTVNLSEVAIKKEVTIPVVGSSKYHADYVMMNTGSSGNNNGQKKFVLEMQGGGETSSTGAITRMISEWETNEKRTNTELFQIVSANPIVTNAWRRQQEQFIVKGNIAQQTGGGLVFCVGGPLYDYLYQRIENSNLNDLRNHNWTLALLAFRESYNSDGTITYSLDESRQLFTNYSAFLQILINQGEPHPEMFMGDFERLTGGQVQID